MIGLMLKVIEDTADFKRIFVNILSIAVHVVIRFGLPTSHRILLQKMQGIFKPVSRNLFHVIRVQRVRRFASLAQVSITTDKVSS